MKNYLAFKASRFEEELDWDENFVGDFDTLAEARAAIDADKTDDWEIVSAVKKCVIESSDQNNKLADVPDPNNQFTDDSVDALKKMYDLAREQEPVEKPSVFGIPLDLINSAQDDLNRKSQKIFDDLNRISQTIRGREDQEPPPGLQGFQQEPFGPPPLPPSLPD